MFQLERELEARTLMYSGNESKSDNQTVGSGIRIGRIPAAEIVMRSEDSHVITHYYPAILEGSLTFPVVASPSNRPTPQTSIEASVLITVTASYPTFFLGIRSISNLIFAMDKSDILSVSRQGWLLGISNCRYFKNSPQGERDGETRIFLRMTTCTQSMKNLRGQAVHPMK